MNEHILRRLKSLRKLINNSGYVELVLTGNLIYMNGAALTDAEHKIIYRLKSLKKLLISENYSVNYLNVLLSNDTIAIHNEYWHEDVRALNMRWEGADE